MTGDSVAQQVRFIKQIQKMKAKYITERAINHQKDAMENGKLKYKGHDHVKVAKQLFEINKDLVLLSKSADKFLMQEMARNIIPKNLKPAARIKYLDKGSSEFRTEMIS